MSYIKTNWVDGVTYVTADRMNNIEDELEKLDAEKNLDNYYNKQEVDSRLSSKQNNLSFGTSYNATTNKAATIKDIKISNIKSTGIAANQALTADGNGNSQWTDLVAIAQTPTIIDDAVTATLGTISSQKLVRVGYVNTLYLAFKKGSSTVAGSNVFEGSIASGYLPKQPVTSSTYVSSTAMVGLINPDAANKIVIRATNDSVTYTGDLLISFTWVDYPALGDE